LSVEQVIAGLDRAVATMKKGERAIISIHPEYAFGNVEVRRDLAIVPPGSNVVYDVEMMDFIKVIRKKSSPCQFENVKNFVFSITMMETCIIYRRVEKTKMSCSMIWFFLLCIVCSLDTCLYVFCAALLSILLTFI